jgi:DnaJ-class molecular chaperone
MGVTPPKPPPYPARRVSCAACDGSGQVWQGGYTIQPEFLNTPPMRACILCGGAGYTIERVPDPGIGIKG